MNNDFAFQSSKFLRTLLVLFFMAVSVQWTFAQLNLNVSRATLGTVIEQIKSQSKYQFFYDDKLASMAVENVKVKGASIEDALNVILKGKNISFKVEDNIVYLLGFCLGINLQAINKANSVPLQVSCRMTWVP